MVWLGCVVVCLLCGVVGLCVLVGLCGCGGVLFWWWGSVFALTDLGPQNAFDVELGEVVDHAVPERALRAGVQHPATNKTLHTPMAQQ